MVVGSHLTNPGPSIADADFGPRFSRRDGTATLSRMSRATPATLALAKAGVVFDVVTYDYDPNARRIGLQAADAIGAPPSASSRR